MYNGIGLQTPKGSGTNGYIQSNKFFIRSKTGKSSENGKGFEANPALAGLTRKPNRDRKRQIELKLIKLEDQLTDEGCTEAKIAKRLDEERKKKILKAGPTAATAAFSHEGGNVTNNK